MALLCFVSCSDVPEDVKSRAEQREETKRMTIRDGDIKYIPLSEMQAYADKAIGEKYSNFTIRKGLKVTLPEKLIECDFVQESGYIANAEEIRDIFFTKDEIKDTELEYSTLSPYNPDAPESKGSEVCGFRSEEKKLHFSMCAKQTYKLLLKTAQRPPIAQTGGA